MKRAAIFALSVLFAAVLVVGCGKKKVVPPQFSGERAYQLLKKQCDFGPRPPKSAAHDSLMNWLVEFLRPLADTVYLQHFSEIGYDGEVMPMANVIARFNPRAKYRIMLCAHWDTRPWADHAPDSLNRNKPILGANDGASGVAVLLHLAELLHQVKPPIGVDIVLFDGEDYGHEGDIDKYLLGSKYFARNAGSYRPKFAILLDMIGDRDLKIPKEYFSATRFAPQVTDTIWARAKSLNLPAFVDSLGGGIIDDHHPLAQIGIKAVDIIDFDYPYWHTLKDTPDKCSPASLEQIGRLLVNLIYNPPQF